MHFTTKLLLKPQPKNPWIMEALVKCIRHISLDCFYTLYFVSIKQYKWTFKLVYFTNFLISKLYSYRVPKSYQNLIHFLCIRKWTNLAKNTCIISFSNSDKFSFFLQNQKIIYVKNSILAILKVLYSKYTALILYQRTGFW